MRCAGNRKDRHDSRVGKKQTPPSSCGRPTSKVDVPVRFEPSCSSAESREQDAGVSSARQASPAQVGDRTPWSNVVLYLLYNTRLYNAQCVVDGARATQEQHGRGQREKNGDRGGTRAWCISPSRLLAAAPRSTTLSCRPTRPCSTLACFPHRQTERLAQSARVPRRLAG